MVYFKLRAVMIILILTSILNIDLVAQTHKVVKGDTIYSLAKKYQVTVEDLISRNKLQKNATIKIGMNLIIAKGTQSTSPVTLSSNWVNYVVKKGDTYYSLAKKSGVSLGSFLKINRLNKSKLLKVGRKIKMKATRPMRNYNQMKPYIPKKLILPDTAGTILPNNGILWPTKGVVRRYRFKGKDSGVQIEGKKNAPVVSIASGKVILSESFRGFGKTVIILTQKGYTYTYCGNAQLFVKVGDFVKLGSRIGSVGINPHDLKAKIVFMVDKGVISIDPMKAPRK